MISTKNTKGFQRKTSLIQAAKKLFHENGYKKTSAKEICNLAEINHKNFNYYFKSKNTLLSEIYSDLYMKSYSFIDSHYSDKLNSIEKNTFVSFVYYPAIFSDEETIRFQQEIYQEFSSTDYMARNFKHVYHQFFKELGKINDNEEIENIQYAELGLRRELVLRFIDSPGNRTIYDLINTMHLYRGRLLQMDENVTKAYLFNASEFDRKNDHTHIRLLI